MFWSRIADWFRRATGADDDRWYTPFVRPSWAGTSVNQAAALGNAAFYSAAWNISNHIAMLPLHVLQVAGDGSTSKAIEHPLYNLLHYQPNPEMDSREFRQCTQANLLIHQNAYAQIQRAKNGEIIALWPLPPTNIEVKREDPMPGDTAPRPLQYVYRSGTTTRTFAAEEIVHFRGFMLDGTQGISLLDSARDAIGSAIAADEFAARYFSNSATPSIGVEYDGRIKNEEARIRLRKSIQDIYTGTKNAHKVAVLEEGAKFKPLSTDPRNSQMLETRQFSVQEIARLFNCPPHLIKDLSRATFSNIEQQSLEYVRLCLLPWITAWEQKLTMSLLRMDERDDYQIRFNLDALLRADTATRFQAYSLARQWGWLNVDEIRGFENLNPLPDGKGQTYLEPLNMKEVGEEPPQPAPQTPPTDTPPADDGNPANDEEDDNA